MKKFYILWLLLCSPGFAMENIEDHRETQSWLPRWEDVKTYVGLGISCEAKVPTHRPIKAVYGAVSMLLGFGEIYLANQIYAYDHSPQYSPSNIPAYLLSSHGTSTYFHGAWVLIEVIPEIITMAIYGKSCEQQVKDSDNSFKQVVHLGTQLLAATEIVRMGTDRGMRMPHFLLLLTAAQISEKFIFKDALKKMILNHRATPLNRTYRGIVNYTAAFAIKKLMYRPNFISHAVNFNLTFYGTADIAGGVKDTVFLMGRVWNNLKLPHYENQKVLLTPSTETEKPKVYNPRPFAKKKVYTSQPRPDITRPEKEKTRKQIKEPNRKSFPNAQAQQHTDPSLSEEPSAPKAVLPTWDEERQQLLHYGITIEPGPYGATILRCGDITRTIKTPLRDDAKISGKKAETIHSMLSLAWENIANTYSVATIALSADLRTPHYYVFQKPCEHDVISALENCKKYKDVTITRNQLINLLTFLDSEERKERKNDIKSDQNLGYYFDASRGDGSHAMYSLGLGMGGITLCKPKNGRDPDELTPEQVKNLYMALMQKGAISNSNS